MSAAAQTSEGLSKSARKRANQKAREAEGAAEAAPPAPAPVAAKAKAQPKAEAAPKAKAKAKAEATAPKAEPKAKAKGKAAPAPEPAPKAEAKAKAKAATAPAAAAAKPKAKGKAKVEEPPKPKVEAVAAEVVLDDGTGGDWEVAAGLNKKQLKRQEKIDELKRKEEEEKKALEAAEKAAQKTAKNAQKKAAKNPEAAAAQAKVEAPKAAVAAAVAAPAAAVVSAPAAASKDAKPEEPKEVDPNISATIKVPQEKIGRLIGPKGANIALIKEKTGVKNVDTAGGDVTVVGLPADVAVAEKAIKELLEKGYMSLAFEDFKEDGVSVSPDCIPNLIGSRGCIIQTIKKECQVEIDIPPVPKNKPSGKVKVSIAGGAVGVEKAKEIVSAIALYSHHEVTHPGFTHKEMDVEEWRYRFLIGKGGSEMRHIQNNFKVRVNIPREGSTSDKVVIIGEEDGVNRAALYIEKILAAADEPKGRAAPEKSEDTWGDEAPEEAWMSAYMYKRR